MDDDLNDGKSQPESVAAVLKVFAILNALGERSDIGITELSVTWESKVVSDNLKVGVTQPVTGKGTRAQAEYRFNQSVSARAQWDNQNQNTTVGNPGVDLRFRFEWE